MCGIAGIIGSADVSPLKAMLDVMARRGPDDEGIWHDARVPGALGHRRLSIIDPTADGHQPMSYASGRYWITFNGELYNYRELRDQLQHQGQPFATRSDTEVIMAAYACWGMACLQKFRGMFAFALVDLTPGEGQPQVVLARDRLGIKPLVYAERGNELWFASDTRAMAATGHFSRNIDPHALLDYLTFGSVLQPHTILESVRMLPPGHYLAVRGDSRRLVSYWNLHDSTRDLRRELQGINEDDASEHLRDLLRDAARYHLVADVPVGAFLSGGMDSAAVVGFMREWQETPIKTFSLGFEGKHQSLDERSDARESAAFFGSMHHDVVIRDGDVAAIFDQAVSAMSQPSMDGINTWLISRAACEHVRVALSGLGGDEIFAGYGHFHLLAALQGTPRPTHNWIHKMLGSLYGRVRLGRSLFGRYVGSFAPEERLALFRCLMPPSRMREVFALPVAEILPRVVQANYGAWSPMNADTVQQTSYAEVQGYLVSTLLRDADDMSMAHSLEIRPMLLDHEVVEFVYALPARIKLSPTQNKPLLFRAAAAKLPAGIHARRKTGFALPFSSWMCESDMKERFLHVFAGEDARALFRDAWLRQVRGRIQSGHAPTWLWGLGILLTWMRCQKYGIPDSVAEPGFIYGNS